MKTSTTTFCLLLLAAGCGGRSVSATDNQNNNSVEPGPDAAVIADAAPPDGGTTTCTGNDSWELTMTPLSSVTVLNPLPADGQIPQGITLRVEVAVEFGGCDDLAGVQYEIDPTGNIVLLTGYVWQYRGTAMCPDVLMSGVERITLRHVPAGTWELVDFMINGPGVPFTIRGCTSTEDCLCDTWQGVPGDWGSACDWDCMCQPSLGCVQDGSGGCYRTCSVSSDCPAGLFCNDFLPQTSTGVCMSTGMLDSCQSDAECEPGYGCRPVQGLGVDQCQPVMDLQDVGTPCVMDCDCADGLSCVTTGPNLTATCEIRCRGNRDCPRPSQCDVPGSPSGFNQLICQ